MKNFLHLRPKNQPQFNHNNKMKLRTFIAAVAVVSAIASCNPKEVSLQEQMTGNWSGIDSIEITVNDTLGNTVIQSINAPIEFEYLADSTFTAKIAVTDTIILNIGGVATVSDSLVTFSGKLDCHSVMDITGTLELNADKSLVFSYMGQNADALTRHKGKAVLTRKEEVKEQK